MNAPTMLGNGPVWNYGANASFGLWVTALANSRMWIALYKGVLFKRKTSFLWKTTVKEVEGETGGITHEVDLTFKQKILPALTVIKPCGGIVSKAEFPIVIFECDGSIVYSRDQMKSFKKFAAIPERTFYTAGASGSGSGFDLPDVDSEVYETKKKTVEETKRGLLVPLWRIDVEVSGSGALSVKEVLDLRTADTFAFEEYKEGEEGTGKGGETGATGEEDPCAPDGGGGGGAGGPDNEDPPDEEGKIGSSYPGARDENGEGGLKPCP